MKLHLPKPLRNSVLACIAAVAGIATPTLGTATFVGGVVAFTLSAPQVLADYTWTGGSGTFTESDWNTASNWDLADGFPSAGKGPGVSNSNLWEPIYVDGGAEGVITIGDASAPVRLEGWVPNINLNNNVSLHVSFGKLQNSNNFSVNNGSTLALTYNGNQFNTTTINIGKSSGVVLNLAANKGSGDAITINLNAMDASMVFASTSTDVRTVNGPVTINATLDDSAVGTLQRREQVLTLNNVNQIERLNFNFGSEWVLSETEITAANYEEMAGKYFVEYNEGVYSIVYSVPPACVWSTGGNMEWNSRTIFSNGMAYAADDNVTFTTADTKVTISGNVETPVLKITDGIKVTFIGNSQLTAGTVNIDENSELEVGAASILNFGTVSTKEGAKLSIATGTATTIHDALGADVNLNGATVAVTKGTQLSLSGGSAGKLNSADIIVDGATLKLESSDAYLGGDVTLQNSAMMQLTEGVGSDRFNWGSAQKIEVLSGSELNLANSRFSVQGSDQIILNNGKISGTGEIDGSSKVVGSLDFFESGTVVSDGTSAIAAPIRLRGAEVTTTFQVNSGTLTLDGFADYSYSQGSLAKTGSGTMVILGGCDYAGTTTVTEGELVLQGANNTGTGSISIGADGVLTIAESANRTLTTSISGSGVLNLNGTITINSANKNPLVSNGGFSDGENGFNDKFIVASVGTVNKGQASQIVLIDGDSTQTFAGDDIIIDGGNLYINHSDGLYYVNTDVTYNPDVMDVSTAFCVMSGGILRTSDISVLTKTITRGETLGSVYLSNTEAVMSAQTASSYTGNIVITSGTTVHASVANSLGVNYVTDKNRSILVEEGATFQVGADTYYHVILSEGATFENPEGAKGDGSMQNPFIELNGNATVKAQAEFGMRYAGAENGDNRREIMNLNGHTLTKTGSGSFFFFNTTINAGTIDVKEGSLNVKGGSGYAQVDILLQGGANLVANANDKGWKSLTLYGDGTAAAVVNTAGTNLLTIQNGLTGDIALNKIGGGTLKVNGAANLTAGATITEGTLNLNGGVTLGSEFNIKSGATLTLGNNVTVNISSLRGFAAQETEAEVTQNGRISFGKRRIVNNENEGNANCNLTSVTYGGSTYTLDASGYIDNGYIYYAVEAGEDKVVTVGGNDYTAGTDQVNEFFVGEKGTLCIAGAASSTMSASQVLAALSGTGTAILATEASVARGTTLMFAGTLSLAEGGILDFTPGKGEYADMSNIAAVQFDGGIMNYNAFPNVCNSVSVTANGGTMNIRDHGPDSNTDPIRFTGTTSLTGNLTINTSWKSYINIEKLTGNGNLILTSVNGNNDGKGATSTIESLVGFNGNLDIRGKSDNIQHVTVNVDKGYTLEASRVIINDGAGVDLKFAGAGTYDLGAPATTALPAGVTLSDNWTGAVRIGGTVSEAGVATRYYVKNAAGNNQDLNVIDNLRTEKSSVLLNGVGGWMQAAVEANDNCTISANLILENLVGSDGSVVAALVLDNGYSWSSDSQKWGVFAGNISGSGEFSVQQNRNMAYKFTGDLSGWTGKISSTSTTNTTRIMLDGKATQLNASIDRSYESEGVATNGIIDLTVNNQATFAKKVNVTALTLGENAGITLAQGSSLEVAGGTTIAAGQTLATTAAGIVVNSNLTFAGGNLTLAGALNLGGKTLTLNSTDVVLTLADGIVGENFISADLITNISGISGFTSGTKLGEVFSVADSLADLYLQYDEKTDVLRLVTTVAENRTWVEVAGEPGGTWQTGQAFGGDGAATFAKDDYAIFGALNADETVTIAAAGVTAGSVTIDAGAEKTYSFTGGAVTTPKLTVTSGTAVFASGTLNVGSLSALEVNGVLDISAMTTEECTDIMKKLTIAQGEGTVKLGGGWGIINDLDTLVYDVDIESVEAIEILRQSGSMDWKVANKVTVIAGGNTGDNKNGDLMVGRHVNLYVQNGGVINLTGNVVLARSDLGAAEDIGSNLYLEAGGQIKASAIVRDKDKSSSFTMSGGTLELTGTDGIASSIATTITGGTLVAKEASWGITGATIGGATVTDGTLSCAVQIQTAGLDTESADDDTSITLTNATLTGTLDNAAGKLVLAGAVTINGSGFNKQETLDDYSNGGTDGFATTDTYYQLVTTAGNLSIADGTTWSMGVYVATGDKAGWVRVDGTEYGNVYYLNTADTSTTLSDIKSHAGTTYTLSSIALNGGNLEYDVTDAAVAINVQESGVIKITDANPADTTEVVLSSSKVTVASGKSITLSGNGVYDIGASVALATGTSLGTDWTGTVRLGNAGSYTTELSLASLGQSGSTVELVGVEGHVGDGYTVESNLKLTNTANGTSALRITNGNEDKTLTICGAVTGSGTFERGGNVGSNQNYVFAGDVQGWTGSFLNSSTQSNKADAATVTFNGSNIINASIIDSNTSNKTQNRLLVTIDDANITAADKSVAVNGVIDSAYSLTLGLAGDPADSRATVKLNNSVTADTLNNYAATTVNGTLAAGAAVTNNGTLELTQAAATLASLAGTGSVTAKSLTLTGAATDSNGITADSLTLQAATNTVGALNLGSLTLGANVTSLTAGELNISGDVVVSKVAADFLTSSGLAADSKLNLNIDEALLQDYMAATNTTSVQLATVAGLERGQVTLNKGTAGWNETDHTWATSDDQYTYALDVDNGVLTLTRATNGIIWNGDAGEKWVMDSTTEAWKTKGDTPDNLAYGTDALSTIFNGEGESKVVVSGAVTTTNVTFDVTDADIDGYTFTDDDGTTDPDSLTIEKNLSINGGELKIQVSTNVGGRTEVGQDGKLTLAMSSTEQNPYMEIGTGLINHGAVTVSEGTVVYVGDPTEQEPDYSSYVTNNGKMTVEGMLGVVGSATNAQQASLEVSKTGMVTAASVSNAGKISSEGTVQTQSMQNDETGVLEFTSGVAYIGVNPTATNLSNAGEITVSGASVAVTGGVDNDGDLYVTGGSLNTGDVDNSGSIAVTGGSLTTGAVTNTGDISLADGTLNTGAVGNAGTLSVTGGSLNTGAVDNDGTLSVAGGSMTVTGNLDNTDGNIIIGTVAVADNPETDEDETQAATNGTLSVTGNLTHAGNGNIVVNSGSTLDVTGDLEAEGMTLGFDGIVTVGGYAEVDNLTINKGASFTAQEAEIGTLANNGTLSVGEVDAEGNLNGGELTITTLTGTGAVNVGKDGSLTITDAAEFTGQLNNQGTLELKGATLSAAQAEGATAGNITTEIVTVKSNATGYNGGSYVMGDIKTDALVIEDIDAAGTSARLDMNSLAAKTTDGVVSITISDDDMAAVVAAGKGSYDLISVGSVLSGLNLTNNDDLTTELMQTLLANGLNMELLPSEAAATAAVAAAEKTVVKLNVREQAPDESIWNFDGAHNTTEAGLIVLKDGKLASNVVLDKVQTVKVTDSQSLDLTGDISKVTLNGLTAVNADSSVAQKLTITGDAGDTAKVTTAASGYAGTLVLDKVTGTVSGTLGTVELTNKAVANLAVTNTDVDALEAGLTLNGSMKGGELSISKADGVKGTLKIDGTDLNIAYNDGGKLTMNTVGVSKTGHVLVNMGQITGDEGDIFIGNNGVASKQIEKYFTNVRFEDKKGVVADRNAVYYTSKLADKATSDNGKTGLTMADEALLIVNPQNSNATGDLATVLNQLDAMVATGNKAGADKLGASLAGASTAVLGMAAVGDVDRQLRAIRNRTTTMGVDQSVVNADMPYFNAWINAEGDSRELGEDETLGGYKLNSYGGTVGFDVDIEPTLTAGMALTAMYGDLDATGADQATGNLDSYYVSAFARYCGSAWTHTFVGTIGMGDISLDRTVAGAQVKGETDSMSFGLMYEVGRVYAMDEDGTTCLQPVFNVTWKHTTVDAYTEKGGDVALSVDEQSLDTITFGLGARLQAVVGESMYNRTSIFECRLLVKADAGDTEGTSKVALDGLSSHEVKSNEMGAVGVEIGAGLTIPLGDEGSSIFMDASAEIRSDYTDVNGTVGYRVNF